MSREAFRRSAQYALLAIVALVMLMRSQPVAARADDLDLSLGGRGFVVTDFGGADEALAVALQPDGKIVVVGQTNAGADIFRFALARYNANGSLDLGFGAGGRVSTAVGFDDAVANAVALQSDGAIVVAGFAGAAGSRDFALARYLPDGRLDPSFGVDGVTQTDIASSDDIARAVAIDAAGRIVVAGTSRIRDVGVNVARYTAAGLLDTTFGNGGVSLVNFGRIGPDAIILSLTETGRRVGLITGASVLLNLITDPNEQEVRIDTSALLDTANAAAIGPDGSLVVAGVARGHFAVARFTANGSADRDFGENGVAISDLQAESGDAAFGVALQGDGTIVAVGEAGLNFAVARYEASGAAPAQPAAASAPGADATEPTPRPSAAPGPVTTPAPAATPEPVTTPTPTSSPSPAGPPRAGDILLSDNFDDPARGVLPRSVPSTNNYTAGYAGGEYVIRQVNPDRNFLSIARLTGTFADASLAIDGRIVGETERRYLLLACRSSTAGEYRLLVDSSAGAYQLTRRSGLNDLPLAGGASSAIQRGNARNRIELRCQGSIISAFVNGVQIASAQDSALREGGMFIAMGAYVGLPILTEAHFDNLVVTQR